MTKSTKQGSEATQFKKGVSGNPGGITAEERARNDALRLWLTEEGTEAKGKAAYLKALDDGNSAVILDWANRRLGKVKDRVEMSEDPDAPLAGWTLADVLSALAVAREAKK